MKRLLKIFVSVLLANIMFCMSSLAAPYNSNNYTSVDEPSELLPSGVRSSSVSEYAKRRGDFFARADLVISDEGNGDIGAFAKAYMDHNVQAVYITIYLDRWDKEANTWRQVDYYDAEFYAEDYPDGLSDPTVDYVFENQKKGYHYRLRATFSAFDGQTFEGFTPTTNGILIQ